MTTTSGGVLRRPPGGGLRVSLDPELLERALTHRSYAYENGGLPTNERLEFLGDLGPRRGDHHSAVPNTTDLPEGQLAKLRASVVNMRALADVARGLGPDGLGAYLLLSAGKGEEAPGGRDKASILADTRRRCWARSTSSTAWTRRAIVITPALRSADGPSRRAGARAGLEDQSPGADRALGLGVPSTGSRAPAGPPQDVHRLGGGGRQPLRRRGGAQQKEAEQRAAESAWRTLTEQAEAQAAAEAREEASPLADTTDVEAGAGRA
ncbi:ribonuclease III [Micromonospora sp. b486]|uniref:ribonuclease III family protein n=1 Tax=Micromonospora sp. b486 TaxID=3053986 RepID=UPI00259CFE69|nr:ribonuclease III [Micromonospora sp. b486]MDM4784476.1 ribonuclease III [Micromonospora sp. b486]